MTTAELNRGNPHWNKAEGDPEAEPIHPARIHDEGQGGRAQRDDTHHLMEHEVRYLPATTS